MKMVKVRALQPFGDGVQGKVFARGQEFEVTPAQAAEFEAAHLVEHVKDEPKADDKPVAPVAPVAKK